MITFGKKMTKTSNLLQALYACAFIKIQFDYIISQKHKIYFYILKLEQKTKNKEEMFELNYNK